MMKRGIPPKFAAVLLLLFLYSVRNASGIEDDEIVDFPQMGNRRGDETYQIYRNPQSFQVDDSTFEEDITKNDTIVIFDKSKPKDLIIENVNSNEYIAPQQFEISQRNRSNEIRASAHGVRQHELFDPSPNRLNETNLNFGNIAYDNFGERYQQWNDSLYHQAKNNEKEDKNNPYPPLPKNQKDESEYFPPSFRQVLNPEEDEPASSDKDKHFGNSNDEHHRDSTRTTVVPNTSNKNIEDITSAEMEEYDNKGTLAKGEEIQYSDDASPTRQTYSTEGIKKDPTMPFQVTHNLMDALNSQTTQPTTYLQDSEATIYPTLVPGHEETEEGGENGEEAMITSDYVSNLEPSQRDRMFSRDKLRPWEKYQNEEAMKKKSSINYDRMKSSQEDNNEIEENTSDDQRSVYSTPPSSSIIIASTPINQYIVPASSFYAAQPPPLSSYILVPSGTNYYGDQAPRPHVVSNSVYGRNSEAFYDPENVSNKWEIEQHKISRENIVTVERVEENGGSDLSRSPQFKLYGIKTAFHKGSGTTIKNNPTIEKYDTWLANPATIFDLPLPTVLKTAFAVNTKAFAAKQHSDNSNVQKEFELDETNNPLRYRKKISSLSSAEMLSTELLQELPDFQVISGGSDNKIEIESYIDEEGLSEANKHVCGVSELISMESGIIEGSEILSQCFVIAENCLLSNAAPIERRINLNLTECANFCAEMQNCKSISYSDTMSICDVFAFQNGTSNSRLIRLRGYHYLQPTRKNIKKCLEDRRLNGIVVVPVNNPIVVNSNQPDDEELLSLTSKVNPSIKSNPCPGKTDIITFKTEHYRLRNFGIDKIEQNPPNSESECLFSCLIDLANGRLPFNCTSASYNAKTNDCILYSAGSNINGNGHLIEERDFSHYEKACANVKLVQQCRGFPINRIPQKVLMGFIVSRERASSLLGCITMCFERFKSYGDCLSVNYYYSEKEDNCFLCSESYLTIPQFFIDETEAIVDHASFDKCLDYKDDLFHVSTDDSISHVERNQFSSLAIDMDDGSRILPSTPGFDIVPTLDEKQFEGNAIDGETVLLSSDNENDIVDIRRKPQQNYITTTTITTVAPELLREKLANHLKKSIKRLKL